MYVFEIKSSFIFLSFKSKKFRTDFTLLPFFMKKVIKCSFLKINNSKR